MKLGETDIIIISEICDNYYDMVERIHVCFFTVLLLYRIELREGLSLKGEGKG